MMREANCDRRGPCQRCGAMEATTFHHTYPQRHAWQNEIRDIGFEICRGCHNLMDERLRRAEEKHGGRLPKWRYPNIALDFITS